MSALTRGLAVVLAASLAAGCLPGGHSLVGRPCDPPQHECPDELVCVAGRCMVTAVPDGGILFQSDWATALGQTDDALRDTSAPFGAWTQWNEGGAMVLTVVAGGPPGYANALRVQQRGNVAMGWGDLRKNPFIEAPNTDYFLRFYFMTNDVSGTTEDTGVTPWPGPPTLDLTYLSKSEGAAGWGFHLVIGANANDGHGGVYPITKWFLVGQSARPLSYGAWYRLEYHVHFTAADHLQVHPRVYDASGALLYQDGDFVQEELGSQSYGGFSDWTLERWYSRANPSTGAPTYGDFQVNRSTGSMQAATALQSLVFGNPGSGSASDTGLFWFYAGLQARTDRWPGP